MDDSFKIYLIEMDRKHRAIKDRLDTFISETNERIKTDRTFEAQLAVALEIQELWNSKFTQDINILEADKPYEILIYRDLVHRAIMNKIENARTESGGRYESFNSERVDYYHRTYDEIKEQYRRKDYDLVIKLVDEKLGKDKKYIDLVKSENHYHNRHNALSMISFFWSNYHDPYPITVAI